MRQFPVILICRDRFTCTRQLVEWFEQRGYETIILIDNDSTYGPLLDWYDTLPHTVYRLGENLGPYAPWKSRYIEKHLRKQWVIVSDPDVLPVEECPDDAFDRIYRAMRRHPFTSKIGFSLKIDDIPDAYPKKEVVLNVERHYMADEFRLGRNLYRAPVDTTLALYRPGGFFETGDVAQ